MHVEIQVALNFFISFLYNKLPRRRVNQFGEELERALKQKFQGHWYPERPYKGSAFRCIKTAPPLDPVFDVAAQESGMALADIQENLPEELSIWIDPGEVSYRLGEKGVVKILYSESESSEDRADREIYRTFNPEAQCFKPIIVAAAAAHAAAVAVADGAAGPVTSQLGSMSLSGSAIAATSSSSTSQSSPGSQSSANSTGSQSSSSSPYGSSPSPTYKSSPSPISSGFLAKSTAPLTFTTATFAQTKFGSTKLKTNGKRCHRMSPTEFSSYIKQRALIQQQQQQQQQQHHQPHQQLFASIAAQQHHQQQRPRSLSPTPANGAANACIDANSFQLLLASAASANVAPGFATAPNQFSPRSPHGSSVGSSLFDGYLGDIFSNAAAAAAANPSTGLFANNNNNNANKMMNAQQRQPNNLAAANALSLFFDNKAILNNNNPSNGSGAANGMVPTSTTAVIGNSSANFSNGVGSVAAESVANSATSTANKSYSAVDSNLNFNGMSYPNQHLLVAN